MSLLSRLILRRTAPRPARGVGHQPRRAGRAGQLYVEALEDRCVLASGLSAALVADIVPGAASSNPASMTNVDGTLFFGAQNPTGAWGLWKSDGTAAGTQRIKESFAGTPSKFTAMGGSTFFTTGEPLAIGEGLWKTDGTSTGTVLIKSVSVGPIAVVNGKLLFTADDSKSGFELWVSDGTAKGTKLLQDIYSGNTNYCGWDNCGSYPNGSFPRLFTNVNGAVVFTAVDKNGSALWRSDGTAKGTALVKDINGGISAMTAANGLVYFITVGNNPPALWRSDGTTVGTVLVKQLPSFSFSPPELVSVNGTLFFAAGSEYGVELWKSNGTAEGTVLVKDIIPGAWSSPAELTNGNGTLFFRTTNGATGEEELWKSDGTARGTGLVKDINPGSASSTPASLTNVSGLLYFTADDGIHGTELWQSDGTASGTKMVQDIYPGSASSSPQYLTAMNNKLYFSANDSTHGRELWDPPAVEPQAPDSAATLIPGELLVSFKRGVTPAEIGRFYADHGVSEKEALDRYARAETSRLKLVSVPPAQTEAMISVLPRDPRVAYAEPNYLMTNVLQAATPTDPYYIQQYALENLGQWSSTRDADIDATDAWKITTGSPDVLVAVIDNGVNYNHPDLVANIWTNPFETPGDGIDNDANGYVDDIHGIDALNNTGDPIWNPDALSSGHGTRAAGLIGATPFNEATAGVAWRVGIISIKLVSENNEIKLSDLVQSFHYLNYLKNVQGQNLIATNNSYLMSQFSQAARDAMAGLDQPGMSPILHVCSAGNVNVDLDVRPYYPASSDLDNIISVAATDWYDEYADWAIFNYPGVISTNYGAASVDLAAPGFLETSTHVVDHYGYLGFSGTSAAAPFVTGAAALVASKFAGISTAEIKARILGGVDPIGHIGNNVSKPTLTNGRLNIANALAGAAVDKDNKEPAAVTSLAAAPETFQSVTLTWTATGDDDVLGRAAFYDIRYSTSPITAKNWDVAVRVIGERGPAAAGASESFTASGLDPDTTYYFALKVRDDMGNLSGLSNVATAVTFPAATILSDAMETGPNGWTATGLWHQSTLRSNSLSHSWYYGDEATHTYDTGATNTGTLTSPEVDLRDATHPVLIYREWRSVEDTPLGDYAQVWISTGSNQWTIVSDSDVGTAIDPLNWPGPASEALGWSMTVHSEFDTPQWRSRAIDLSAYVGHKIRLRFLFDTANPNFNGYEGWYVDDVNVFDAAPALHATTVSNQSMAGHSSLSDTSSLGTIEIRVGNLGGRTLGQAAGRTIWLDDNAAGWGWFVHAAPRDDSEHLTRAYQGERGRMDLLTAIAHELGHLLGYEHSDQGAMRDTLAPGEWHTPGPVSSPIEPAIVDLIFIDEEDEEPLASAHREHDLIGDLWTR
jgi:ELWxxDGT repeat protein